MKLFYCRQCHDIRACRMDAPAECHCGSCTGHYTDRINVVLTGPATPIGINNRSFLNALAQQPDSGQGREFTAFVIPEWCVTVTHE